VITTDIAAEQQRMGMLMNRVARDNESAPPQDSTWEASVGASAHPRRSPWMTLYEDPEAQNPAVSDTQVLATSKNILDLAKIPRGGGGATGGSSLSQSELIAAVTQPAVIAAIVAALPIIDFKCPG